MPPSSGELWGRHFMPTSIVVDCLLPTGIIVPLDCVRDAPLRQIKMDLWAKAKQYPLYNLLGDPSSFIFVSVTQEAETEEFYDESKRLCDLHLFREILRVVEPIGNKDEKIINYDIGIAIGRPIHDFDEMEDLEVQDFRRSVIKVCKDAVDKREANGADCLAGYVYPPDIETCLELPPILEKKLDRGHLKLAIWIKSSNDEKLSYTIRIPKDCTPEDIIAEVILQHLKPGRLTKKEQHQKVSEDQKNYLLKVCGCDDYFLGDYPITQYKHIRKCIAKAEVPNLMLLSRDSVLQSLPTTTFHMPSYTRRAPVQPSTSSPTLELWNFHTMFKLKVLCATYVHVRDVDMIYVKTALYHGPEPLCNTKETNPVVHTNPSWNQWLDFELYIPDIPRSARLCVSICSVTKRKKKDEYCMLAWGNINLFDYKDMLLQGKFDLNLWPVPKMNDELLHPLGITGSNPYNDSPCLQLEFVTYESNVCFPSMKIIENYAKQISKIERSGFKGSTSLPSNPSPDTTSQQELNLLQEMALRDPLSEITEQEKEFIWQLRNHCPKIPNLLPKLLDAVKWNCRDEVAQLYVLLQEWPQVPFETALELLDCKYADLYVRKYAVKWLDSSLTDEMLFEFLLQLVQTLKHESYLDNDLTRMLLSRALLNRKIGHYFFWHLRSELHNPSLSVRFGLVLEAYCRGLGHYLKDLNRQVEALDKLVMLTNALKEKKDEAQKERIKFLCDQVQQQDYVEALQNFVSPLNITHKLGNIITEKCRIMDSAKRPLWLIWSNSDSMKEMLFNYFEIIFKNGDDLRQDMLTLQVIRIMDNLWRKEGLDLRMMPYICLATGNQVGMIEVVERAKTVYGIQKKAGKLAAIQVDSTQLHKWIKDSTKVNNRYEQAIENFTLSCAGYCVATFILGIGDRNPDNIMVNEDGQIFHIDFGHFLGHFKKKFGINRERVPFVLTEDFLYVFAKGAENPKKSKEFQEFQELCGRAYLVLRKHANLLITLFTMMLSTGIPELQSISDVEYLRKTLAVEKTDEEALEYFQNQFFEAYGGAWTTKLDWFFHSVKHM